jgi:hypothetical protein
VATHGRDHEWNGAPIAHAADNRSSHLRDPVDAAAANRDAHALTWFDPADHREQGFDDGFVDVANGRGV